MINITIDTREKERKYQAYKYYTQEKNINHVTIAELPTGDYIFYNNPQKPYDGVVFEYKTVEDFIQSIKDGRVFNQSIDQNQQFKYHYIIIVGTDQEAENICNANEIFTIENYYGAIDRLSTYTRIRQVPTQQRAFTTMLNTSIKCLDNKTIYKQFPKNFGNPASRYLCNNVPGVGGDTATLIADNLHLQNLDDLIRLDKEKLLTVKGIGNKIADNILKTIRQERIYCENDKNQTKLI